MQEFYLQLQSANFLHCCQWNPACEPIGVVQIVHGVAEHVARYAPFAEFLTQRGYLVVGEDHPGHGKSVPACGGSTCSMARPGGRCRMCLTIS